MIELVDANHKTLSRGAIEFEVPEPKAVECGVTSPSSAAKLIVDKPEASALAGGLALIHYRTENVQLLPVYGATAATLSPQIGHVHITVDDASWHWSDATGQPVVVNGLPPGPHKILIELVDANHKTIAQELVKFNVPRH